MVEEIHLYSLHTDPVAQDILRQYWGRLVSLPCLAPPVTLDAPLDTIRRTLFVRLDAAVTIQSNHLLKLPFSIHPDTGKVTLPLSDTQLEFFSPEESVSVSQVHLPWAKHQIQTAIQLFQKKLFESEEQEYDMEFDLNAPEQDRSVTQGLSV